MKILLIIAVFFGFLQELAAVSPLENQEGGKKYNLSVCAIFKNEAKYLKEWIEYHRLVGVDHFYLYNVGSSDSFRKILEPYIAKNIVTLIHWPIRLNDQNDDQVFLWAFGTQIPAYENASQYVSIQETKWLVFLDVNEFLVSPSSEKITEILQKYEDRPGVDLLCNCFDATEESLPLRKLVIETVNLVKPPLKNPQREISKTVFKPELCKGFTWPPYTCHFKDEQIACSLEKSELRINKYLNRSVGFFAKEFKSKLHIDNRSLSDQEVSAYLSQDYEIEDKERVIYRYIPELQKKMKQSPIWGW